MRLWRLQTEERRSIGPSILALLGIAVVLAFLRSWRVLAADGHFVFFWNPAAELGRYGQLWYRDIDLGGVLPTFAPLPYLFMTALRAVGLDAWVIQRIWLATVIGAGGVGAALFTRALRPSLRTAPFVAGVAMMVAPYTTGFVLPSWLYVNTATLPWLCLCVWQGTTTGSRWRWAALFAVVVSMASAWNPPGALWAAMSLLPLVAYAVASGRATLRSLWGWAWRAGALLLTIAPAILLHIALSASTLEENIGSSESKEAVSRSSSWSESLRGLGSWRMYWNPRGPLLFRFVEPFFTNWVVVVASFVALVLAVLTIVKLRGADRIMLGSMLLLSAMVMVGGYPLDDQAPLGRMLFGFYGRSDTAFSLRSVYKAGAGLVLATAVLVGIGVASWFERRPALPGRWAAGVGLVGVALLTATPWLTGSLFWTTGSLKGDIPTYWNEAADYINSQPGDGAALVVPATTSYQYRWGAAPNGDIFPSLVERPVMAAKYLSLTPALQHSTIQAMVSSASNSRYQPGTIGPMARRLGVRYVVVRNDLVWETAGVGRPSDLDRLRHDPDLRLVATLGRPGENTTSDTDVSPKAELDAALPPVEIYEVVDFPDQVRAVTDAPNVLLSGDGAGWRVLARHGSLGRSGPIEYTGTMDTGELTRALAAGSPLVITDSNRRYLATWGTQPITLTAEESADALDNFGVPGSQSTVTFGDATSVVDSDAQRLIKPTLAHRPAAALDGNLETTWLTGLLTPARQDALTISFAKQESVGEVTVHVADVTGGRTVTSVAVYLGDDTPVLAAVEDGVAVVDVDPVTTSWVKVQVAGVEGVTRGPYGFAEIAIGDLDLRERVVTPTDVARAAENDPELQAAVDTAAVAWSFERIRAFGGDVENSLARRFDVMTDSSLGIVGTIEVDQGATDEELSALIRMPFGVATTSRLYGLAANGGLRAVDGDRATAWKVAGTDVATLGLSFERPRPVRTVTLAIDLAPGHVLPQRLTVRTEIASASQLIDEGDCEMLGEVCQLTITLSGRQRSDSVALDLVLPNTTDPVVVSEIEVDGRPNNALPEVDGCRSDLVEIDGRPVHMELGGSTADLIGGVPVAVRSCEDVDLSTGDHDLFTSEFSNISDLIVGPPPGESADRAVALTATSDRRGSSYTVSVPAHDGPAVLLLGQAQNPSWVATTDGRALGEPLLLDGQAAWVLTPASAATEVSIEYGPQSLYRWLLVLLVAGHVLAVVLIVVDPRRARRTATVSYRSRVAPIGYSAAIVLSYGLGGPVQMVIAVVLVVALVKRWLAPRDLGTVVLILLGLVVLGTLPILGPGLDPVSPFWPAQRNLAHIAAREAAVLLWVAMAGWVARGDEVSVAGASWWRSISLPTVRPRTRPVHEGEDAVLLDLEVDDHRDAPECTGGEAAGEVGGEGADEAALVQRTRRT